MHRLQTLPRDFKPFPAPLAYSCIAALPASAGSPPAPLAYSCIADLPLLFLWASKSDVRHFAPPSNPPPRLQTLPSAFGLLLHRSLACASREPGERASKPLQPQRLWPTPASQACLFSSYGRPKATLGAPPSNPPLRLQTLRSAFKPSPPLSAAGRPVAASLWPVRSLPPLFLWASEGDVRHFGPPSNAPRQLAGLLRPLCGLSEACLLSSYGLPKATLGILDRLRTLLGSWQAWCGLSVACPKPASSPATRQLAGLLRPLCGLSEAPSNAPRQLAGLLRPLCGLSEACLWPTPAAFAVACPCLLSSCGLPKATVGIFKRSSAAGRPVAASLWPVRSLPPLFLWASEGDVRHFGPPSNALGSWQAWCGALVACPNCLLSSYGLPKATLGILDRLQTLLGSWQACCGLSVACPKPASSLLMGFRRRR